MVVAVVVFYLLNIIHIFNSYYVMVIDNRLALIILILDSSPKFGNLDPRRVTF